MAYIKYKELTKYFNFNKRINEEDLPTYVTDYFKKDEKVIQAYQTSRDKGVFTNERMVLFDVNPLDGSKKIHIIPYSSISSSAILYKRSSASILFSFDSGYQMELKFIHLDARGKTDLRKLFSYIINTK
jgi:hypothetical protein